MEEKLHILETIRDNKDVLFSHGQTPTSLELKVQVWKNIAEEARRIGYPNHWKHLRDTTWKNWRRRTLEKRDNIAISTTTDDDGNRKCKTLDQSDMIILDIVGHDFVSPLMQKMLANNNPEVKLNTEDDDNSSAAASIESDHEEPIRVKNEPKRDIPVHRHENTVCYKTLLESEQLEIARRQKYKLDLELFKLERELQLPASKYTKFLHESIDPLRK